MTPGVHRSVDTAVQPSGRRADRSRERIQAERHRVVRHRRQPEPDRALRLRDAHPDVARSRDFRPARPDEPAPAATQRPGTTRTARLIALLAGIAGILLCGLVPLLPVQQSTATINWPQAPAADGNVESVTAPLVSGAPQSLDVSVPCTAIATLPPATEIP